MVQTGIGSLGDGFTDALGDHKRSVGEFSDDDTSLALMKRRFADAVGYLLFFFLKI